MGFAGLKPTEYNGKHRPVGRGFESRPQKLDPKKLEKYSQGLLDQLQAVQAENRHLYDVANHNYRVANAVMKENKDAARALNSVRLNMHAANKFKKRHKTIQNRLADLHMAGVNTSQKKNQQGTAEDYTK